MSRVALIKLFSGLSLSTAQLSGELERAGHHSHVFHFKEFENVLNHEFADSGCIVGEIHGAVYNLDGSYSIWPCYKPFLDIEFDLLIEELRQFAPDAIGFSIYSGNINGTALITRKLKEVFSVPFIWGGPGPTLEPDRCLQHVEYICMGEGEEVIVEFAERVKNPAALRDIAGVWHKDDKGEIVRKPNRPRPDLETIAMPNWKRKHHTHINGSEVIRNSSGRCIKGDYPIMTQRGCPFSCAFCIESAYQDMFGKSGSLRRRSPDLVMQELRLAKQSFKLQCVYFWDDVFTINPRWLDEFLPQYKQEIGLPFYCYTYPTTHDPETLRKLKDAGCNMINMGVQSGSERILRDYYKRPTSIHRVIEAAQEIVDSGIPGFFDLITMSDFETEEDLIATFNFLLEMPKGIALYGFAKMVNYPGHPYTLMLDEKKNQLINKPDMETYRYYLALFSLTRSPISKEELIEISRNPEYRRDVDKLVALSTQLNKIDNWNQLFKDQRSYLSVNSAIDTTPDVAAAQS